ncbi:hypothetical protein XENOCAPTIV_013007 [Xenoophorus captivus]|uniref:Helicase ATP-binding domain-containing protein n=1 Tax=Xenoophorus captivus TaxID=1517983 RepID=A0ABV0SAC2_9TELE
MENGRDSFPFPYKPYGIQEQFMKALYGALDQGKVGIFESPTGTSCEDDEAFKLLQLSKEEETETPGDQEDEELIVAEYESDDESKSKSSVCPYIKAVALQQMRDEVLGTVQDIEQLLKLGKESQACPYYSTRLALCRAQSQLTQYADRYKWVYNNFGTTHCFPLPGKVGQNPQNQTTQAG